MIPRKIPTTIASQHPDHASKPFWYNQEFIPSNAETEELIVAFRDLGIDEYKWDWEGKLVDENVIDRLFSTYYDYFKENPLGKEKFITYRLPNPFVETEQRLGRAFMGILSASALSKSIGLPTPAMFEVILPMCESAHSMIDIQESFAEIANLKHWLFGYQGANLRNINLIPLFEQVDVIANSDKILAEYLKLHEDRFGYTPPYLRPYVARSDPSLNSGHVATTIAIKQAFSKYADFEDKHQVELYPMIGCAALLFRGGMTPLNIKDFISQYAGVKTVLIQSAFRYDYTKDEAVEAIKELNNMIPKTEAQRFEPIEYNIMNELIKVFEEPYKKSIEALAPTINQIAQFFPKRRERVQHTGLFGYSRGLGKASLPRAIKFTGSLYSIGLPPSIIGAGRGLKKVEEDGLFNKLLEYYVNFKKDYQRVCRFVNISIIKKLARKDKFWGDILEDLQFLSKILSIEISPKTDSQIKHYELTEKLYQELFLSNPDQKTIQELITEAGICRKSLG